MGTAACTACTGVNVSEDDLQVAFTSILSDARHKLGTITTSSEAVDVTVLLISGDVLAELTLSESTRIGQVKKQLRKCDKAGTPACRYKLLFQEDELKDWMTLQETCVGEFQKIVLHLIRVSHSFARVTRLPEFLGPAFLPGRDFLFEFLVIGDCGSGKTSVIRRFADDSFSGAEVATIGFDFKNVSVRVDEAIDVRCQIWDANGQHRCLPMTRSYFQGSHGCVIVFDVANRASFTHLCRWHKEFSEYAPEKTPVCIVGHIKEHPGKQRIVTQAEAREIAAALDAQYFEVSAKSGTNIADPFHHLIGVNIDRFADS